MSVLTGTIDDGRAFLSSTFLEFCAKVRNNDPSILPEAGKPFRIHQLSEREYMELADALLENNSVTYLDLYTDHYTKSSVEAMAKYVRTSKCVQRIRCNVKMGARSEEILCCFLRAFQESTSLRDLDMEWPRERGPSNLAFENMLTHTQSLRSLSLRAPRRYMGAAARSGLKKELYSTRAHTGIFGGSIDCLLHYNQAARPSSPSNAMFAWKCGGSEWIRDCVAK
jgi:hypothetical protein